MFTTRFATLPDSDPPGQPEIWNIAEERFYRAIQIVDLYHAQEHYWTVARAVFGSHQEKLNLGPNHSNPLKNNRGEG